MGVSRFGMGSGQSGVLTGTRGSGDPQSPRRPGQETGATIFLGLRDGCPVLLCPETRNATPWSGVSDLRDRSPRPVTGPPEMSGRSLCSWPFAGFAGWLFPFQGRSLASALAGPAVLNAGWINQAAVHHWRY